MEKGRERGRGSILTMLNNIEQHRERRRERERLKTLPYTLNFQKNHRCFARECIDSREPNFYERCSKHWEVSDSRLPRLTHLSFDYKTCATLQDGSVDPKKLQSSKFICTIHWWHFGICNLHQCSWHRYILTTKSKCTLQTHPDISPRSLFFRYRTRGT